MYRVVSDGVGRPTVQLPMLLGQNITESFAGRGPTRIIGVTCVLFRGNARNPRGFFLIFESIAGSRKNPVFATPSRPCSSTRDMTFAHVALELAVQLLSRRAMKEFSGISCSAVHSTISAALLDGNQPWLGCRQYRSPLDISPCKGLRREWGERPISELWTKLRICVETGA